MSRKKIATFREMRAILKETEAILQNMAKRQEAAEAELKAFRAEAEKQQAERRAEYERQAAERKAEAEKQQAERRAEYERQAAERKAEAEKQQAKRKAEAEKRRAEYEKQRADQEAELKAFRAEAERQAAERKAEAEKQQSEQKAETERLRQEFQKERKETERKLNKISGEWDNRIGELIEHLMTPSLDKRFQELGFGYEAMARDWVIKTKDGQFLAEIDVFMQNGESAMAVEVKTKLSIEYVKAHLARMKVLREYANRNGDKRVYLAGAAGAVIQENVKDYALSQGLYVIEMSGETVTVVPPKYVAKWAYTA